MRMPARGLSLAKVSLILARTGMERAAHSIRRRPLAARLRSLISWSIVFSLSTGIEAKFRTKIAHSTGVFQ